LFATNANVKFGGKTMTSIASGLNCWEYFSCKQKEKCDVYRDKKGRKCWLWHSNHKEVRQKGCFGCIFRTLVLREKWFHGQVKAHNKGRYPLPFTF